jgi:hypothetical protein
MIDNTALPTRAYDLLETLERQAVDEYVKYAIEEQHRKRERIIHALYKPIPYEYIKRSKDALYKPLLRAAVAERINEEAVQQDLSPERTIKEFATIAHSQINDYMEDQGFGDFRVKSLDDIPPSKMGAIKSIESKPGMYGLSTKVTLHDKLPALKAMAEMQGIIASDKPPVLEDYVKPPVDTRVIEHAPQKAYTDLLESISSGS